MLTTSKCTRFNPKIEFISLHLFHPLLLFSLIDMKLNESWMQITIGRLLYMIKDFNNFLILYSIVLKKKNYLVVDVSSIGACRPRIFFINGFLYFLEDK